MHQALAADSTATVWHVIAARPVQPPIVLAPPPETPTPVAQPPPSPAEGTATPLPADPTQGGQAGQASAHTDGLWRTLVFSLIAGFAALGVLVGLGPKRP